MWCANYKEKKGKTQADIRHGPHASDHTHQPTHLKIPLQEPLEQHGAMTDQRTKWSAIPHAIASSVFV
jgi:hypothetical protein